MTLKIAVIATALVVASSIGVAAQTYQGPSGHQVQGPACYRQIDVGGGRILVKPVPCADMRQIRASLIEDRSRGPVQGFSGGGSGSQ